MYILFYVCLRCTNQVSGCHNPINHHHQILRT